MSVMGLDPPDYWLLLAHGAPDAHTVVYQAWTVASLCCPDATKVLLVRIDPPYRLRGAGDQDFVILQPGFDPSPLYTDGPEFGDVELAAYTGRYTGQPGVAWHEMSRIEAMVACCSAGLADALLEQRRQAETAVAAGMPTDPPPPAARQGCTLALACVLGRLAR